LDVHHDSLNQLVVYVIARFFRPNFIAGKIACPELDCVLKTFIRAFSTERDTIRNFQGLNHAASDKLSDPRHELVFKMTEGHGQLSQCLVEPPPVLCVQFAVVVHPDESDSHEVLQVLLTGLPV
jgi:hypothetical protein